MGPPIPGLPMLPIHLAEIALLLVAGFILRAYLRILGNLLICLAAIWLAIEILGELTRDIGA
jgi:uncharacterized membrane protein YedE/YeeE